MSATPPNMLQANGISLEKDIVVIVGPPDSGKSNLAKYLLSLPQYRSHLVYDPLFGFDENMYNVVRPPDKSTQYRRYEEGNKHLNIACDKFIIDPPKEKTPKYFAIDECGRLLKNGKPEGDAMGELNDFNAHYGVGIWLMGQRLAQLNTDFENKATHYFVTGYQGKNDRRALKDIHEDLPEYLDATQQFGFTYVGKNNTIMNFRPVDKMNDKSQL